MCLTWPSPIEGRARHRASLHRRLGIAALGALVSAAMATPAAAQAAGADAMQKDAMATSKGTLQGAEGHQAGGGFEIHGAGKDRHVRLGPDFKVERGPDVYVVLARGAKVVDGDLYLGKLKRFSGASDYAIPANADLAAYTHLVLWCKKYSVAMGTAPLPRPAMAGGEMAKDAMSKDGMAKDSMGKDDKMMKDDRMMKDDDKMTKDDKIMQPDSAAKP